MPKSMDIGLWRKVKPLFEAVLELPPAERQQFIEANTRHEPAVASHLFSMLQAHSSSTSLLDRSVPERINALPDADDRLGGLCPGQMIGGRYRLSRELGRGGNGYAWKANDEAVLGRAVVVKVLRIGGLRQAFDTELSALAQLDHPLIAAPLDSGILDDGRRYIVLEFVNGPTLRETLKRGPLEPMPACRLVRQIAQALDAAHKQGVWHLDLKPDNVLLREAAGADAEPVLVDFGISRLRGTESNASPPAGSLAYAAPEQLSGAPSGASDQYSLARMAVEMITGHRPIALEQPSELLARCAALHPRAIRVLARAMSPRPEGRYLTAPAFAAELQSALDPRVEAAKRRRLLAAAFCFLLFGAMAAYTWLNREKESVMLQHEAQATASQIAMVAGLLDAGYLDQKLLADVVRTSIHSLKVHVDAGELHPDVLRTLYEAQMRYGVMHGHPGTMHLGSVEVGIRSTEDALQTIGLLYKERPKDKDYYSMTLRAIDTLSSMLIEAGQYEQCAELLKATLLKLDGWERGGVLQTDPTNRRASMLMTLSRVPFHRKQWDESLALRNEGVRLMRIVASRTTDPSDQAEFAGILTVRGSLFGEMGRLQEASQDYEESDAILERLKTGDVRNHMHAWLRAKNRLKEARILILQHRLPEAHSRLEEGVELHRQLLEETPNAVSIRRTLALSLAWLASTRRLMGQELARWRPLLTEAGEIANFGLSQDPQNVKAWEEADQIRAIAAAAGVRMLPPSVSPPAP